MRPSLEIISLSKPQAHQSQQWFQRFYDMIDKSQAQFFYSEAQMYLENLIIYGFQRTAVSTISNPYEGLKLKI